MRIRWTEPAARDLITICDYVKENGSAAAARSVGMSLYDRVGGLAEFPEMGRPGRREGTRELVFTGLPYLAIYRVRGDTIEVLRILHGAQKWP